MTVSSIFDRSELPYCLYPKQQEHTTLSEKPHSEHMMLIKSFRIRIARPNELEASYNMRPHLFFI